MSDISLDQIGWLRALAKRQVRKQQKALDRWKLLSNSNEAVALVAQVERQIAFGNDAIRWLDEQHLARVVLTRAPE